MTFPGEDPRAAWAEQERIALARAHVEVDIIAYHLREARRRVGVSRERVAADLGVDISWIDALESERAADVPLLLAMRYARLLGASLELRADRPGR